MLDIGWSELLVLVLLAVVVVGPKELPRMMRTMGRYIRKARSMAGDLQRGLTDIADQSDIADLKKEIEDIKSPFTELNSDLNNRIDAGVTTPQPSISSPSAPAEAAETEAPELENNIGPPMSTNMKKQLDDDYTSSAAG